MKKEAAIYFRDEFKKARDSALKDAEGYQQILFVLERMGAYRKKRKGTLKAYKKDICGLVKKSHPFEAGLLKDFHISFDRLYEMVSEGRNDALHQGAVARIMTSHSVQLSMMLEDTLMAVTNSQRIGDYMVRNPVCAYEWQPISLIRQIMLGHSFSHIPFFWQKKWHVVSDLDVARIHQNHKGKDKEGKLASTLECCIKSKVIEPQEARTISPDEPVCEVLKCAGDQGCTGRKGWPVLVTRNDCKELLGIVTPYDLM